MKAAKHRFEVGSTTLYAQLASLLRSRIRSGEWKNGAPIPSIKELCANFHLGRVTVRQALQILSDEGLVSSQRGRRTIVTFERPTGSAAPLFSSIGPAAAGSEFSIKILSRYRAPELPVARWAIGTSSGTYIHIRKVDLQGREPYALSSIFIANDLHDRLPKGADAVAKLAQLAVKHSKPPIASARERLTVEPADFEAATHLLCPMAAPVARAERVFCDASGRVVYYAVTHYRGDRFNLERNLNEYVLKAT